MRTRRGVVYDSPAEMVQGPSRDAEGNPITPGFRTAMNKTVTDMPAPRWVCGLLGIINGGLGISERGQGPVAAEIDTATGRISRFFVTEPYERRAIVTVETDEEPENG